MTDNEQDVIFDSDEETFDYSSEAENLSNQSDSSDGRDRLLINLTEGKNTVTFLTEPSHEEWNYGTDEEPDIAEKMVYKVEVDGSVLVNGEKTDAADVEEDMFYAVTRGKTESSQWGQLTQVGRAREGLKDETVTIFRNGTGKDTSYLVQEAAELKDE